MTKPHSIRMSRLYAMVVALAGLLVAASAGAAPTRATTHLVTPRKLFIQHGRISQFAQDGDLITWIGGRHYVVHLRGVSSGRRSWVLDTAGPGAAVGSQSASALVLGGKRAVWVKYAGVMTREAGIYTTTPGQKKPTLVDTPSLTDDGGGANLTGLAADGEKTIVYGVAVVKCVRVNDNCAYTLAGGGVHRIIAGHKWYPPPIKGIPAPFAISASQGRVAVVPAAMTGDPSHGDLVAALNGPVEVYNLSGRRLTRVFPQGTVREVGLSWPYLAVLVRRTDGTTAIERYDTRSRQLLTTTAVTNATNLAIGSGGIVFLVDKAIYTIRAGQPTLLWRATMKPIGLSIEGRRVAWAANGRIWALNLSR
jgi:hypothetical protein